MHDLQTRCTAARFGRSAPLAAITTRHLMSAQLGRRAGTTADDVLDVERAELMWDDLLQECADLDEDLLRHAAAAPSTITLLGLVQHLAEVERNWFRRVLAREDLPPIFTPPDPATGHDGGFDLAADDSFARTLPLWRAEVERARAICAGRTTDDTVPFGDGQVTVRWILIHMIGEYARHCGHADLIRENLDGRTGV